MPGLNFRRCCRSCLLLCCLWLLPAGCADQAEPPAPTDAVPRPAAVNGDIDRNCSTFYFLWGRHAELLLRFEEALEFYQKALICDEEADYISEKIPILLLRLERTDEASAWLAQYLKDSGR